MFRCNAPAASRVQVLSTHGCNTSNRTWFQNRTRMTLTWFEHAAFWSGVRRATVAPQSLPWRRRPLALTKRKITNVAYKAEISTDLQKFFLARAWQDSNLQSPDPKSGALSIRPHGLLWCANIIDGAEQVALTRYVARNWEKVNTTFILKTSLMFINEKCCNNVRKAWMG